MRGRKPKPTALKILHGDQACRINLNEPVFGPVDSLVAPSWLGDIGKEHWDELAPMLQKAGLLTEADRNGLAIMCDAFNRFRVDRCDDKAREMYRRMLTEFGLTPSSRSRIKSTAEKPKDSLGEFLSKRKI